MSRFQIAVGDVFSIPLDEERVCYGQIVAAYRSGASHYYAIFETPYQRTETPDLKSVVSQKLAFLAMSLDAKLYVGDWTIVGRVPVPPNMPFPAYKLGHPDLDLRIEDYTAKRSRPATEREVAGLRFRSTVAPVRLEKAIRALHGVQPWDPDYNKLEPDWEHTTALLFP